MNNINRTLIAIAASGLVTATPGFAAEPDRTPQHIGAGTGAVAGALVGGPLGLVIGTAFGAMIGNHQVQEQQITAAQISEQQTSQALADNRRALKVANGELASRQAEISATQSKISRLNEDYVALKSLVSDLQLSVYFAQNSSELSEQDRQRLQALGKKAGLIDGLQLRLASHTNASGTPDYNQHLSVQRGETVSELIQQHGLPPFRMMRSDKGADEVTSSNPYAAQDRRVDLQFEFDEGPRGEALFSIR